jgi:hypothetical protein
MPFEKGKSGNPAGRPKGEKNKVTKDVKKWLLDLFLTHSKTLETDLKAMTPRERWEIIAKILPFIVPKLQAMDAKVDLNNLSDEQLTTIIEAIKEEL